MATNGASNTTPRTQVGEPLLLTEAIHGMMHNDARNSIKLAFQDSRKVSPKQLNEWFIILDKFDINTANKTEAIILAKTYQEIYEALGDLIRDVRGIAHESFMREVENIKRNPRHYSQQVLAMDSTKKNQRFDGLVDVVEQFSTLEPFQQKALLHGSQEAFGKNIFESDNREKLGEIRGTLMWLDNLQNLNKHINDERLTLRKAAGMERK